jgi:hypothetical protein
VRRLPKNLPFPTYQFVKLRVDSSFAGVELEAVGGDLPESHSLLILRIATILCLVSLVSTGEGAKGKARSKFSHRGSPDFLICV